MRKDIEFFGAEGFGVSGRPTPLSPAVKAGDFLFVSGLIPRRQNGDILGSDEDVVEQTHVIMANMNSVLALAGCDLRDVVKTNVYLRDPSDFAAFNDVYSSYFKDGNRPARTCLQNDMVIDIGIEIDVIAYCRCDRASSDAER